MNDTFTSLAGFTPTEIRDNIHTMLRKAEPTQHMIDFAEKDIPPHDRDPGTHKFLTDLM